MGETARDQRQVHTPRRGYYPATAQLITGYSEHELDRWVHMNNKATLACVIRELIGQFRVFSSLHSTIDALAEKVTSVTEMQTSISEISEATKQIPVVIKQTLDESVITNIFSKINYSLSSMNTDIASINSNTTSWSDIVKTTPNTIVMSDASPATPSQRSNDMSCNVLLFGVKEPTGTHGDRVSSDKASIDSLLSQTDCSSFDISDYHRRGKFNAEHRARPIVISFVHPWQVNVLMSKACNLKASGTFIKCDCSVADREIEKKLLSTRYQLIEKGVAKNKLTTLNCTTSQAKRNVYTLTVVYRSMIYLNLLPIDYLSFTFALLTPEVCFQSAYNLRTFSLAFSLMLYVFRRHGLIPILPALLFFSATTVLLRGAIYQLANMAAH